MPLRFHTRPGLRRTIQRLAEVVCPPDIHTPGRTDALLDELDAYLGAVPLHSRRGLIALFAMFDQGARLYPPAHGQRFVRLDDARAESYYVALTRGRLPALRSVARLLKGLITLCYYEIPEVQAQLGYHPAAYIAAIKRRRIVSYAGAIKAAEQAIFADRPVVSRSGRPPSATNGGVP